MDFDGDILDPQSYAAIAQDAVDKAMGYLVLAQAARDAAALSAADAAAAQAKVKAIAAGLGVVYQWVGPGKDQLQLLQPDGSYGPAAALRGPEGPMPPVPVFRTGSKATGPLAFAIDATDPANPIVSVTIPSGEDGWSPRLALVADGARYVHQVVDWAGGSGTKPAAGLYLGAAGLVADIAQAVDVRGVPGPTGANFIGLSTTPRVIGLGSISVALTAATAATFAPCAYQALISQADARFAMVGLLQGYDPATGTLSINVLAASGSGTRADWLVAPSMALTVPPVIDDGFYDAPQPTSAVSITYAAGGGATTTDDGTY